MKGYKITRKAKTMPTKSPIKSASQKGPSLSAKIPPVRPTTMRNLTPLKGR